MGLNSTVGGIVARHLGVSITRIGQIIFLLVAWPVTGIAGEGNAVDFVPVTDEVLQQPADSDWLMWRRTLDAWGYSPLSEINPGNVGQLRLVWTRGLEPGIQEGMPLVYRGTMYFPNPNDITQALDAATGDLLWEHRRRLPGDLLDYIPVVVTNRNLAIYGNLIIDLSGDNYIYALDATTGEQVWESQIRDYTIGGLQSSGPIIADGKAVSGRGCQPKSGPDACVITAHDALTGKELWRTRTIPRPGEPGSDTWGDIPDENRWHVGAWLVPSYDPVLRLIYAGTSVTAPAPKYLLAGNDLEYLHHNSTLALDVDTGRIVWHYQHLVDHWDLDHTFERLLVDTAVAPDATEVPWINPGLKRGEIRKVVTGIPGKTGIVYTLDRETGEFLWARPTVEQNVVERIDPATGKVFVNPETLFTAAEQQRTVCPSSSGGRNWPGGAYSPLTKAMYVPMQNTCQTVTSVDEAQPGLDSLYSLVMEPHITPGAENVGSIHGIGAETGKTIWKYEQRSVMLSLLATGGRLLFGGDAAGRFRAFDQDTGKVLWEVNLGSAVTGYPIAFAVNGRQYIAVSTGIAVMTALTKRLTPEVRASAANNLFVFALPDG